LKAALKSINQMLGEDDTYTSVNGIKISTVGGTTAVDVDVVVNGTQFQIPARVEVDPDYKEPDTVDFQTLSFPTGSGGGGGGGGGGGPEPFTFVGVVGGFLSHGPAHTTYNYQYVLEFSHDIDDTFFNGTGTAAHNLQNCVGIYSSDINYNNNALYPAPSPPNWSPLNDASSHVWVYDGTTVVVNNLMYVGIGVAPTTWEPLGFSLSPPFFSEPCFRYKLFVGQNAVKRLSDGAFLSAPYHDGYIVAYNGDGNYATYNT
jgi:hypothetical protein